MVNAYTGNPTTVAADKVRLLIGDTGTTGILTDLEIADCLADASNNTTLAAIYACEMLVAEYAAKVSKKISDQSINYSDLQDHYIKLAEKLQKRYESYNYGTPEPTSGSEDVDPRFESQQFDYV